MGLGLWKRLYVLERLDLGKRLWLWALRQLRLVVITALRERGVDFGAELLSGECES
jgi:hypothetical protein